MGQVRHGSATTTHAVRAAIQRSQASLAALSRELGINPKTVAKWRKRATVDPVLLIGVRGDHPSNTFVSRHRRQRHTMRVDPGNGDQVGWIDRRLNHPHTHLSLLARPLARRFKIKGVPTILIFKGGEVVDTIVGAVPKAKLEEKGKKRILSQVRNLVPSHVSIAYVRQHEALGLGHAVLCAKQLIGDEPFAILLADDLIDGGDQPCLKQMVDVYKQTGAGILAVQQVERSQTDQYGIVDVDSTHQIQKIVEKPKPEQAPSNLGVVGRYILPSKIFELLEKTQSGSGGEIQLTDAIAELIKTDPVIAHPFTGVRYDCGSKLGFLKANLEYGIKHPEFGDEWLAYLKARLCG